ncbi:hypothetical protein CEB3_c27970 [Peptococcaceae bacterium CEB3]|nr:hypothetical protein CEB3_c27970 [Peptococcaceae bacterium CEB3]
MTTGSGGLWEMCHKAGVITFVGAGGKTTAVRQVTEEIDRCGFSVIASTTTKVFPDGRFSPWQSADVPPGKETASPCFWYAEYLEDEGKWRGPGVHTVDRAIAARRRSGGGKSRWVIEGDGARGKKLKLWRTDEPQIPLFTECAVLVFSSELWGNLIREGDIHRPEIFPALSGEVWKAAQTWAYLKISPVFNSSYQEMAWVVFSNGPVFPKAPGNGMSEEAVLGRLEDLGRTEPDWLRQAGGPRHLRLAVGDAKEGRALWYDLW